MLVPSLTLACECWSPSQLWWLGCFELQIRLIIGVSFGSSSLQLAELVKGCVATRFTAVVLDIAGMPVELLVGISGKAEVDAGFVSGGVVVGFLLAGFDCKFVTSNSQELD